MEAGYGLWAVHRYTPLAPGLHSHHGTEKPKQMTCYITPHSSCDGQNLNAYVGMYTYMYTFYTSAFLDV